MEIALFREIIKNLRADGCKTLCFVSAQGEALLHPDIFEMLEIAITSGFETNLVTNGTPLNEKRITILAALKLSSVQFSFCGYDKKSYEDHYIGAKFERTSYNLATMIKALKKANIFLSINGVAPDEEFMQKSRDYLISLGAPTGAIRLQLAHNWGGTVKVGKTDSKLGIFSRRNLTGAKLNICPLLLSTQGIYVDGRVTACGCIDANGALEVGNMKNQSMSEIRKSNSFQKIISAFRSGDVSHIPLCKDCEIPYRPEEIL